VRSAICSLVKRTGMVSAEGNVGVLLDIEVKG
jgi:hypothetical protein